MFKEYKRVEDGVVRGACGAVDIWVVSFLSAIKMICSVDIVGVERRAIFRAAIFDSLVTVLRLLGFSSDSGRTLMSPILTGGGLIVPDGLDGLLGGHTTAVIRVRREPDGKGGWLYRVFEDDTELTADKLVGVTLVIFIDECSASGVSIWGAVEYLISLGYRGEVWFVCAVISNFAVRTLAERLQVAGNPVTLRVVCSGVYGIVLGGAFFHHKPLTDFVVLTSQLPVEQTIGCFVPESQREAFSEKFQPKSFTSAEHGAICPMGDATDSLLDDEKLHLKQLAWLLALLIARSRNKELILDLHARVEELSRKIVHKAVAVL
ncbi:MAG: hypothetical protein AAB963_00020 [Patescibacteria group bacterium]